MLNIQVQCCGMLILWLVTYFYSRIKKLHLKTQKAFQALLITSNICVAADILSVFAIYYAAALPPMLVRAVCKFYLMFLISVSYCGLRYIYADVYVNNRQYGLKVRAYSILLAVSIVLMFFLPIYYYCSEDGRVVYSYGPTTSVAYAFAALTIVSILWHMLVERKKMHPRRKMAVIIWYFIWGCAAVLQFMDARLLVVTFAGIMGVAIIFTMIENPESNIDKLSGFFNINAMMQHMVEAYGNERSFSLLCTSFREEEGTFYKEITDSLIFVGGGEIFLMFYDKEECGRTLEVLQQHMRGQQIYVIPDSEMVADSGELLAALREAQRMPGIDQNDTVCWMDELLLGKIKERKNIELLIREAIENNRVEVFYQPIYSTVKESFCSAEALMRIRDKNGDIVLPGKFIPVAECDGSIVKLGKIVFDQVCRFLSENKDEKLGLHYIEVNLSIVQGENKTLSADILDAMRRYGVEAHKINLEITESASVKGKRQLLENMKVLQEAGVEFSLDDFGTGQSNLDYMASMPVQLVKFDRSMTQGFFDTDKTRHIMSAAIQMIHGMGMKVVVEGIETEEQFQDMKEQQVEYIQGFYFARPMSEEKFKDFLRKNNNA